MGNSEKEKKKKEKKRKEKNRLFWIGWSSFLLVALKLMMVRMSAKLCRRNKKQILTIVFHKDRDSTPADEETDEVETGGERVEEKNFKQGQIPDQ